MTPPSRRAFLFTVVAGSTLAAAPSALAVDRAGVFRQAGAKYGVPPALLAAISYGQSRWTDHGSAPSRSHGYGPMNLIDGAGVAQQRSAEGRPAVRTIDTLGDAAAAAEVSPATLRTNAVENVRAAAALLAKLQRSLGGPVGATSNPAAWFEAISVISGLTNPAAQLQFADDVLADLASGLTVTDNGTKFSVAPQKMADPGAGRTKVKGRVATVRRSRSDTPPGLGVESLPAPYAQYGPDPGDYGNHDLANRPISPRLTHLVIHDTECSYETALQLVNDPTYLAWNYTVRSSDGHIAQHLDPKDVGWHAGNWYFNAHSIGVEHEGYAPEGYSWFTEAMYRRSARLISALARAYRIPLDRGHIVGHDQVPGTTTPTIAGMHWDPGPYWDWEHYFELMGAPLNAGTSGRPAVAGDVVRILPGFSQNVQPVAGDGTRGTNFVPLYSSPTAESPLVTDPGIKSSPSTTTVSDVGGRAAAGTDYVVAEVRGDWTAVWFLGALAWFHNPVSKPTARVVVRGRKVTAKVQAQTFGRAYPEASAYANPADAQPISPLLYTLAPGQSYALLDDTLPADYYRAKTFSADTPGDHINIVGTTKYLLVSLGHRVGFVLADEVTVS
ncbi:N-acetylmuramoyl-L-alanine amidase [Calidifontibacter terrae]